MRYLLCDLIWFKLGQALPTYILCSRARCAYILSIPRKMHRIPNSQKKKKTNVPYVYKANNTLTDLNRTFCGFICNCAFTCCWRFTFWCSCFRHLRTDHTKCVITKWPHQMFYNGHTKCFTPNGLQCRHETNVLVSCICKHAFTFRWTFTFWHLRTDHTKCVIIKCMRSNDHMMKCVI